MEVDVLRVAQDYGPAALSVVGSFLLAAFGFAVGAAKWAWDKHNRRMAAMADAVKNLSQAIERAAAEHHDETAHVWKAVHGLRADLHTTIQRIDPVSKDLAEVQGSIKTLNQTIMNYAERMAAVSGKLDAVFRFMDAPKRASDS